MTVRCKMCLHTCRGRKNEVEYFACSRLLGRKLSSRSQNNADDKLLYEPEARPRVVRAMLEALPTPVVGGDFGKF